MRDWTTQFISGIPLHETKSIDTGEPTPEQILEEERQMLLDEGDLIEYKVPQFFSEIIIKFTHFALFQDI